ncbi:unnamed protein product, partial [Symbiodinium microadriaticum]
CLWILIGCLFYTYVEGHTSSGALYRSVSYGYGLLWVPIQASTLSGFFARYQFTVGLVAISTVRALLAKKLVETDALWYVELKAYDDLQKAFSNPSAPLKQKLAAWWRYFLPRMQIYVWCGVWLIVGVLFGTLEMRWTVIDAVYFSVTVMTG